MALLSQSPQIYTQVCTISRLLLDVDLGVGTVDFTVTLTQERVENVQFPRTNISRLRYS